MDPVNKGAGGVRLQQSALTPDTPGTHQPVDKATMIAVMRIFMTKNITVHFISAENRKRYLSLTLYVITLSLCSDIFCL